MVKTSNYGWSVIFHHFFSTAVAPCKYLFHQLKKFRRNVLFDIWSISNGLDGDRRFSVLYIGQNEMDKNYFSSLIFKDSHDESYAGRITVLRLIYCLKKLKKNHDIVILKSNRRFCKIFKSNNDFVVPDWINCEIELNCDLQPRCMSKNTFRSNMAKVKRGGFGYSISRDLSQFDSFYHDLYLPYLSKRHADSAFRLKYEDIKQGFMKGELLQITENQTVVAGAIIDYRSKDGNPRMFKLGVLNGDYNYVKKGALIALYFYAIQYLKEKGFQKLSLGLSRPFFSDGVLHHKLNWGAKMACESSTAFLFTFISRKNQLKQFLYANPFIIQDRCNLSLVCFKDHGSQQCLYPTEKEKQLSAYGIQKMVSYSL